MHDLVLKAVLQQQLKLTPQLMQSMEILQMNSQELLDHLGRITEENPLLEQDDSHNLRQAYEELRQKASWLDGGVYGATFAHGESETPQQGAHDKDMDSLSAFLCDQLERKRLPKGQLALCRYLAQLVDEDGRLFQEDIDGLTALKIPQTMVDQGVALLQSLEPTGVAARSLEECLTLQLQRLKSVPDGTFDIVANYLTQLSRKHYGAITKDLRLTLSQIQKAEACIASLEPHPGRTFQPAEPTVYVRPDVFVIDLDGELQIVLNEYYLPRISISAYYTKLLKESDEADSRTYLTEKLQQAKWLLNALERRGSTLQQCANAVLETQRNFFAGHSTDLAPMKLSTLAEQIGVHPSTVSRALRGKYLQCRQGTFPMRYFFSHAVGEDGLSEQAIKTRIAKLVKEESPQKPLSDQKICTLLEEDGIQIARRTVTKYRIELGFGSSTARKKRT
ncbi:RNA polymerase factor sigma-54 [Bengtsoniella intestinalis]|uniref:RNA polymerase factor sigma-54 n=1 Tax=Bengtsoniella intestinalis TaxID=3073143 RepID=UPI00391F9A9F